MEVQPISKAQMVSCLETGTKILQYLLITSSDFELTRDEGDADALIEVNWPNNPEKYKFIVKIKSRSSAQFISQAISQVKLIAGKEKLPLIMVPYLSEKNLAKLKEMRVCGIDLCGNGVVVVPGKLYVFCTGHANRFRDSRPLMNPYKGRSAMVARMFLNQPSVQSLNELKRILHDAGMSLSLSQVSKAVSALVDDMILGKTKNMIKLIDANSLLDRLVASWRKPVISRRQALRLTATQDVISCLSNEPSLRWVITGESSAKRYIAFSQGGPLCVAVSNLNSATQILGSATESVRNFADIELIETNNDAVFFGYEVDGQGRRWSNKIQTLLELSTGEPRQKEAARELRSIILNEISK